MPTPFTIEERAFVGFGSTTDDELFATRERGSDVSGSSGSAHTARCGSGVRNALDFSEPFDVEGTILEHDIERGSSSFE